MNNFQQLQNEFEGDYERIGASNKRSIESTLSTFKFIANIFEVYLPKIGDLLIAFAGGRKDTSKPHSNPSSTPPNLQDFDSNRNI